MRFYLTQMPRFQKRLLMLIFDAFCIWVSIASVLTLRLSDLSWLDLTSKHHIQPFLFFLLPLSALPFFVYLGLYRGVLRYINSATIFIILKAVVIAAFNLYLIDKLFSGMFLPRSVPFLYALLLGFLMVASRFSIQRWLLGVSLRESFSELMSITKSPNYLIGKPILIYGRGQPLIDLISVLDSTREYRPVAIIDNERGLDGGELNGYPVSNEARLHSVLERYRPEEILLAIPEANRAERKRVILSLEQFGLPIKTIPSFDDLSSGRVKLQEIQDIDIDDVLGREQIEPHLPLLLKCVKNKVVMITGAGGSIGSEIVRQILQLEPQRIVLMDHSEFNLYAIDREISLTIEKQHLNIDLVALLSCATDQPRLFEAMSIYKVNTVYHAAAYKHVPIVEHNISQGLINNVFGTLATAQASLLAGVENFVLISTDKAVRPTNIMGASKRLGEMVLQALAKEKQINLYPFEITHQEMPTRVRNSTCFTMVRFGNVLGSSGSVIPVFKDQIRMGGPITITHPDINRYFMSIPEAAQLVIQAGSMAKGGEVFVLDMGSPVKIVDLAISMVTLSGLTIRSLENPEGDIEMIFTGLRPGEKLYEELLIGNNPSVTEHPRIFQANEDMLSWDLLSIELKNMKELLDTYQYRVVRENLQRCVNGFKPDEEIVDWLETDTHYAGIKSVDKRTL